MPYVSTTYIADNQVYPYGTLSEEQLVERVTDLLPGLLSSYQPDLVVIACNSASTLVLQQLRALTTIPVVGVVPAVKPAAQITRSNVIGILATPGTIKRPYTEQLINDFASNSQVIRVGSAKLVEHAEQKFRNGHIDSDLIAAELEPFLTTENLDTVVLGCTHFPFLEAEISQILGAKVQLIDSGAAIARRIRTVIGTQTTLHQGMHRFLFTEETQTAQQMVATLRHHGFHEVGFHEVGFQAANLKL